MIVQPSAEPSLTQQIAAGLENDTSWRIGTVVAHQPSGLTVDVGGGLLSASFLSSYEPFVGDVVAVARQEATWLVLGSMGMPLTGLSAVPNYSFEDGEVGLIPPNWQLVTTSGSPTLTTESWTREDFIDGVKVGRIVAGATASTVCQVVSDPVLTLEGEVWSAAAWVATTSSFGAATAATVELRLAWYSDSTLGSFLSEATSGVYAVTRGMPWRLLRVSGREGYPTPTGARFLRAKLAFSWTATSGETISFDRFLARRIS